jgi:hypothetical protein
MGALLNGLRSLWILISIGIFSLSTVFTHRTITNPDANISEWHISYALGFVRRGFRGELLELWQLTSGLDWSWAESSLRSFPIGILTFIVLRKISGDYPKTLLSWAALLFPLGLLYFLFDPGTSGTTDALFLLLVYATFSCFSGKSDLIRLLGLFSLSALVSLMHEGYVFFLPLVLGLAFFLGGKKAPLTVQLKNSVAVVSPFIIQLFLVLIAPKPQITYFCAVALERLGSGSCAPLTLFTEMSLREAIGYSLNREFTGELLLLAAWIIVVIGVAIALFLRSNLDFLTSKIVKRSMPAMLILSSAPIFTLGADWGRWLSIIYGSFFLSYLFAERKTESRTLSLVMFATILLPVISGTGSESSGIIFWLKWFLSLT